MGIGSARGDDRAVQAAELAISSPLLEASIDGAHGVLLSIQGGSDLGLFEINEAARLVQEAAHPEANIIFGAVIDDALGDEVRVTVIAAGFDSGAPTVRRDPRALGQVSAGRRPAAHESLPVRSALGDLPPVFTPSGQEPHTAGADVEPAPDLQPAEEENVLPSFLSDDREPGTPVQVPRVFEERPRRANDELDLPDFLKNP